MSNLQTLSKTDEKHLAIYDDLIEIRSKGIGIWGNTVSSQNWKNHRWQLKNSLKSLEQIGDKLDLTDKERAGILLTSDKLSTSITPYFFNLIDSKDPNCPIRKQMIPRLEESWDDPDELIDPCGEDKDMPVPGLVHRYPDRVLFLVTDRCASYCRYCTRSRVVSGVGKQQLETQWEAAFDYLERNPQIRDVLLSGGDPLLFSDSKLERLLTRLRAIKHVQFIRIGSRIPIFLPQRITPELCQMLAKFHPLFISIHTNHPKELTLEVQQALNLLASAGIPLGNQSVLLKGINDCHEIQRALVHKLLLCRVKPYYLYQCDLIKGSNHFRTSIQKGLDIIKQLRGHTSGYAIPQYVVDGPGGGGKIPLDPEYIVEKLPNQIILKNYDGNIFNYPEPREINPASQS